MDQINQLQRQIQDLRQEVNSISQVAGQLQRSEANHAMQHQQMMQSENMANQHLQTIQQLCSRLSQEVNNINSIAQQIPQMVNMQTGNQFSSTPQAGQLGSSQIGGYGSTTRYGMGFSTNQQPSGMAGQGQLGSQSTPGMMANYGGSSTLGSGLPQQTGYANASMDNYNMIPAHPVAQQNTFGQNQQYPPTGQTSSWTGMGGQNTGQYGNF